MAQAAKKTETRKRRRYSGPRLTRDEVRKQALANALADKSAANYETIIEGFMDKGIEPDDIIPRVNVFTYNAWQELGRQVRKGEKGVKIVSMVPVRARKDGDEEGPPVVDGDGKPRMRSVTATVFHISQTDPIEKA
ncbi:TPA: ArdC-like ssDNA-binding domain-containing protein [Pseudomonas aeruginosa]